MAKDTQANLGFEKQLWDAACVLWGSIPAAEYRQIIVGLIFLRYISAAFEKRYAELVAEGDGFEDVVRTAVSLGGDCDTLTCIAAGIAEAMYGIPDYLKRECRDRLPENMKAVLDRFDGMKRGKA